MKPSRIEVYPFGHARFWQWRAIFPDGEIENSPESYLDSRNAKAIAKLCFPGTMILVLK